MLNTILRTLGFDVEPDSTPEDEHALEVIARVLHDMPPDDARYVAAFAYLLSRAAHADHHLNDVERQAMERLIAERADLPPDRARLVVELATEQSMKVRGTQDYPITRAFAQMASPTQKRALIDCLFSVAASDAAVVTAEDNDIRRVASEIAVPHEEFVAIRARYRDRLAVLHKPASPEDVPGE